MGALLALGAILAARAPLAIAADAPYVVVLKNSVADPGAVARAQTNQDGGQVGFVYSHALKGYSATLSKPAVEALRRDPRVDYVTVDHRDVPFAQTTPTGIKRVFAPSNALLSINGKDDERANVDVAVIDTGIDKTQSDLNVFKLANCVPPNKLKEPEAKKCTEGEAPDEDSHGTHVAGTLAAIDNAEGVVGIAPGARLWGLKVFTLDEKKESTGFESWIVAAVDFVTAHASEIEVANMSLGCGPILKEGKPTVCEQKALDTAIKKSIEAGVVYVVAAGNSAVDAKYVSPANNPSVITVSAIADYDGLEGGKAAATCESKGGDDTSYDKSNFGSLIDVTAPGVCILSTVPGGFAEYTGTSMATPHVAGAAAILASMSNPENKTDVEAIRNTIVENGNLGWKDTSGDGVKEPLLDLSKESVFNLNG